MPQDRPPHRTAPHFATHWGTYRAEVRDGRLTALHDWEGDPDPSAIGQNWLDALDHPTRVRRPAIRASFLKLGHKAGGQGRGQEPFVEVPWDEALDIAAAEIARIRDEHGPQAIYGGSYGWASAGRFHHAQSQIHRFLNCAGGYTASIGNYSYAAVNALAPHVVGPFSSLMLDGATSWPVIAAHTDLIVAFGGLPRKNAQVTSGGVGRHVLAEALRNARANGCDFVNISPIKSDLAAELGADHLAVRPGSDTALMLGLCHALLSAGLENQGFLSTHCTGWDRFRAYLTGATDQTPKTPDWAAPLCEIPAEDIRALARRMAAGRTLITVAWSLQRADNGEQPCWAAIALAAMLGQIGLPGGGFGIGYASENGIGNSVRRFKFPSVPQGENRVKDHIPVARISDALLNPGGTYRFDGETRIYPDLRMVVWAGGNPFHHHQDVGRLTRAIRAPDCVLVNEIHWTAMARHADIVLPATAPLERADIAMTHWEPLIVASAKATEPVGQSWNDYDIYAGLAGRLGVWDAFTEGRDAEDWLRHLWDQTRQRAAEAGFELPTLEGLREAGTATLPAPEAVAVLMADFRADPVGAPLATPSGRIELFSQTIADMGDPGQPGHPVWTPPMEWLGAASDQELHLITNQPETRLHSQLDPGRVSMAAKVQGREPVTINPTDAGARGIADGDVVRIWNARGACLAGAVLSDDVRPGVLRLPTGAWYDPVDPGAEIPFCKHGSANVLTRDAGTSALGQGPSAQSALVRLERFEGDVPEVTAFVPPAMTGR
ncbi:MAG: biotin/methionine sulfoxide reductase [Paracoccaceae bacterium]|jgi:biotin/methionine sulfoxide reductase